MEAVTRNTCHVVSVTAVKVHGPADQYQMQIKERFFE